MEEKTEREKAPKPLSDDAILKRILPALEQAIDNSESEIASKHASGMRLYLRDPFLGDETPEGRNRHVDGGAYQAVSLMAAQLSKIFAGQARVVEYRPRKAEDEALAAQMTEVVNYLVNEQNSPHYFSEWVDSALITGLGIVTADLEDETSWTLPRIVELPDEQLPAIVAADEAGELKIVETGEPTVVPGPSPELPAVTVRQLKVRYRKAGSRLVLRSIPVDTFIVSRDAQIDQSTGGISAALQGYSRILPRFKLVEMGFDKAKVAAIPSATDEDSELADIRSRSTGQDSGVSDTHDDVTVYEIFVRMDLDQDGFHELVRLTIGGEPSAEAVILNTQEVSVAPFAAFAPFTVPNTLFGNGLPHLIEQEIRLASMTKRGIIDNIELTNNPMRIVTEGVNMDDLLNPHANKIVRADNPNAISYVATPSTAGNTYPFLNLVETTNEQLTGVGPNMMGIGSDSLKVETATGAAQRASSSQLKVEYLARRLAQTGYSYLFKIVTSLLVDNPEAAQEMTARLTNSYVPISVDGWDSISADLVTNIAYGVTNKSEEIGRLQMLLANQQQGLQMGLAAPAQLYQTMALMAEAMGYPNAGRFFMDPAQQPPQPPAPPPPDPALMKAQADMEIAQAKLQMEQQKLMFDQQLAQEKQAAEIALMREKAAFEMQLRRDELIAEAQITAMQNPAGANIRSPY